jgi:DNA-binding Xre family transcriptional regulator/ferredoxin
LYVDIILSYNNIIMAIRVKLDHLLLDKRITLTELADRIGITLANLSVLKTNKAKAIRFSTLEAVCRELNCQPGDLRGVWPVGPLHLMGRIQTLSGHGCARFGGADNTRLVLAIEQDAHVDILHACGGNARCTTCRVEFIAGEPTNMTIAEKERLEQRGLSGVRLSCQIVCDHDMNVRAISRLEGSGRPDPGSTPLETVQPPPQWISMG